MPTPTPTSKHRANKLGKEVSLVESDSDEEGWQVALSKKERKRLKSQGGFSYFKISVNLDSTDLRSLLPPVDSPALLRANFNRAFNKFLSPSSVEVLNRQVIMNALKKLRSTGRIPKPNPTPGGDTPAASILCLGLGNPGSRKESLNQLAFLTALVKLSEGSFVPERTFFYDPMIIKDSRDLIREQGFRILSSNQEGEYALPHDKNTFVFLPFTPLSIPENLIAGNFHRDLLNRVVFLANPVKPREDFSASYPSPHISVIKSYRRVTKVDAHFDNFSFLQIQWFEIPPEETLKKPPNASRRQKVVVIEGSPLATVKVFIDGVHEGEDLVDEVS